MLLALPLWQPVWVANTHTVNFPIRDLIYLLLFFGHGLLSIVWSPVQLWTHPKTKLRPVLLLTYFKIVLQHSIYCQWIHWIAHSITRPPGFGDILVWGHCPLFYVFSLSSPKMPNRTVVKDLWFVSPDQIILFTGFLLQVFLGKTQSDFDLSLSRGLFLDLKPQSFSTAPLLTLHSDWPQSTTTQSVFIWKSLHTAWTCFFSFIIFTSISCLLPNIEKYFGTMLIWRLEVKSICFVCLFFHYLLQKLGKRFNGYFQI